MVIGPINPWDESTVGERHLRLALCWIYFPKPHSLPLLVPLLVIHPTVHWLALGFGDFFFTFGIITDAGNEAVNGMTWLRGETGEQGLHSLNFPSVGMLP